MEMYQELHKWDEALDLAEAKVICKDHNFLRITSLKHSEQKAKNQVTSRC